MFILETSLTRGILGGLLIGGSAASLSALTGLTLGASGILKIAVEGPPRERPWHLSFLAGLLASGAASVLVASPAFVFGSSPPPALHWAVSLLGGVLVGWGTSLSNGCTSGHGVCGLPRASPRSLVAVGTFMGAGALTAAAARSPLLRPLLYSGAPLGISAAAILLPALSLIALSRLGARGVAASAAPPLVPTRAQAWWAHAIVAAHGAVFGAGLAVSGMADPNKVLRFLDFAGAEGWDPQLMAVMGAAVAVQGAAVLLLRGYFSSANPPLRARLQPGSGDQSYEALLPVGTAAANMRIDAPLVAGAAMFGVGWGLTGVCPGPGLLSVAAGGSAAGAFMVTGMLLSMAVLPVLSGKGSARAEE